MERIERVKAEERKKATLKQNASTDTENFPERNDLGETRDIVATKSGFGSGEKYLRWVNCKKFMVFLDIYKIKNVEKSTKNKCEK
ncbi:hypothetical protein NST12_01715 [Bacillus sp. FSL W8-1127]|uniref:hypothetical protein n=1 Tax=Bacillus sp. FSL W8-1127 TaxID=2954710 RepID=UPI0030F96323